MLVPRFRAEKLTCPALGPDIAQGRTRNFSRESLKDEIEDHADVLFTEGQKIFRHDTFGSEAP